MSEKVKLTREQAEALESSKETLSFETIMHFMATGFANKKREPLNDLDMETVAKALINGYEVEEAFKSGDWVIHEDSRRVGQIYLNVIKMLDVDMGERADGLAFNPDIFRQATTEEIKTEKKRRMWKGVNRKPAEFKVGDVITWDNGQGEKTTLLTSPFGNGVFPSEAMKLYADGDIVGFYPAEEFVSFKESDDNV